ncbi:hypothetical protein PCE1_001212 [Barthelona sp. PCE]
MDDVIFDIRKYENLRAFIAGGVFPFINVHGIASSSKTFIIDQVIQSMDNVEYVDCCFDLLKSPAECFSHILQRIGSTEKVRSLEAFYSALMTACALKDEEQIVIFHFYDLTLKDLMRKGGFSNFNSFFPLFIETIMSANMNKSRLNVLVVLETVIPISNSFPELKPTLIEFRTMDKENLEKLLLLNFDTFRDAVHFFIYNEHHSDFRLLNGIMRCYSFFMEQYDIEPTKQNQLKVCAQFWNQLTLQICELPQLNERDTTWMGIFERKKMGASVSARVFKSVWENIDDVRTSSFYSALESIEARLHRLMRIGAVQKPKTIKSNIGFVASGSFSKVQLTEDKKRDKMRFFSELGDVNSAEAPQREGFVPRMPWDKDPEDMVDCDTETDTEGELDTTVERRSCIRKFSEKDRERVARGLREVVMNETVEEIERTNIIKSAIANGYMPSVPSNLTKDLKLGDYPQFKQLMQMPNDIATMAMQSFTKEELRGAMEGYESSFQEKHSVFLEATPMPAPFTKLSFSEVLDSTLMACEDPSPAMIMKLCEAQLNLMEK